MKIKKNHRCKNLDPFGETCTKSSGYLIQMGMGFFYRKTFSSRILPFSSLFLQKSFDHFCVSESLTFPTWWWREVARNALKSKKMQLVFLQDCSRSMWNSQNEKIMQKHQLRKENAMKKEYQRKVLDLLAIFYVDFCKFYFHFL